MEKTGEGEVLPSRNWQRDNSEKVKMGIAEMQERLEVPVQICIFIQEAAQQARSESGLKIFEVFW